MRRLLAVLALAPFVALAAQPNEPPEGFSNWSFDELTLANGAKFQGLILAEMPDGSVRFQSVSRPPGRPTVTLKSYFTKLEVAKLKRLPDAERATLKERLAELDPSGEGERKRMASLELVAADWPGKPDAAKRYDSEYFTLISTGSEELTRRSAVRLEQLYNAFTRFLPPSTTEGRPTQILLATNRTEYRALLGPLGDAMLANPAVFLPDENRVLCGHDLQQLGTELQSALIQHSQQLVSLDKYAAEVRKLYKQPELKRYLDTVEMERKRVWTADATNGARFHEATRRVFAVLFHEAFHAYVGTFVFPHLKPDDVKTGRGTGALPRWLNEGLAQVFESSVVEAGELRADTPDRERLNRAKDGLKGKNGEALVPLGDLLAAGRDAFLTSHTDKRTISDRAYLGSWALAYYLTFERRLIGTDGFKKYLVEVNSGGDPRRAFVKLVGQELPAFEKDWHAYLLKLQSDGTLAK